MAPHSADAGGAPDTPLLTTKKFAHYVESVEDRIARVVDFLQLVRPGIEHQVVPIEVSSTLVYAVPRLPRGEADARAWA